MLGKLTTFGIGLLFFLHGAKLSREALVSGMANWRLHLLVLAATFVMFPLLGLALKPLAGSLIAPQLYVGVLFLCTLPSTVQSSIAFTSMARGNVAAAVCSASASNFAGIFITPLLASTLLAHSGAGAAAVCAASASNLLGIFLTPVLVGFLMHAHGETGGAWASIKPIIIQLLLPFVAGQLLRPWIGPWIDRHKALVGRVDRGSILLVVYSAFSAAVIGGIWHKVSIPELGVLLVACAILLGLVMLATVFGARALGFSKPDEVAIVFCGSKKSLASGVPMAGILFPGATAGILVLPLMIFHQIQLMACSVIAQRYGARPLDEA